MKRLQTDKPIAYIDIETTGLNILSDRIVELTMLKVHPHGHEERGNRRNTGRVGH